MSAGDLNELATRLPNTKTDLQTSVLPIGHRVTNSLIEELCVVLQISDFTWPIVIDLSKAWAKATRVPIAVAHLDTRSKQPVY